MENTALKRCIFRVVGKNAALRRCILKLDGNKERNKMENRNLLRNKSRPFYRGFPFRRDPVITERQTFVLIDPCSLMVYSRESPLPLLDGEDGVVYTLKTPHIFGQLHILEVPILKIDVRDSLSDTALHTLGCFLTSF